MDDKERWEKEKEELQFLLKFALAKKEREEKKEKGYLTDEDIDNIICDRLKEKDEEEVLKEYLVDNALLTCTSASWWDFKLLYDGRIIKTEGLPYKVMSGDPTTFLRVRENDMYSDGLHHATVADTKQKLNIMPFPCNCMEFANEDEEKEIVENIEECEKNGVCQYLMDLEDEWENIDFAKSKHLSEIPLYKEFPDADAATLIDGVDAGGLQNVQKTGITMTSVLFCKHGGFIYPLMSGQARYADYSKEFTYIDKDGNKISRVWTISNEEFLDVTALTIEEIEEICNYHNPELVDKGFAEGIYNYCVLNKLNPKILLATLGQERGWCKKGGYEKAFGVGPGGKPQNFSDSESGIAASCKAYIKAYNEGLNAESLLLTGINCDVGPDYNETKAQCGDSLETWQSANGKYVAYMENGQDIECVNAVMYAKLRYTPWVDFPPANSHPLEDWLSIYNSLEECLSDE